LVLSQHPLGRQLLGTFGFKYPDEQKLVVATEKASDNEKRMEMMMSSVKDMQESLALLRADRAMTQAKLEELGKTVSGFRIDLDEFRKHINIQATAVAPQPPKR
jgi:hypothetical protein